MKERREFERFDLQLPARVETETPNRKNEIFALKAGNISAGGALFHAGRPLPEGTRVRLSIILEIEKLKKLTGSQCHINVKGTVVRSEEEAMAVRFQPNYDIMSAKGFLH